MPPLLLSPQANYGLYMKNRKDPKGAGLAGLFYTDIKWNVNHFEWCKITEYKVFDHYKWENWDYGEGYANKILCSLGQYVSTQAAYRLQILFLLLGSLKKIVVKFWVLL